ncbi:hypothetical protein CJ030_MR3G006627 [Morella rubra]|uniref:Uncharacterized protein n=1 Tax=Morella rubra TaxID=262757 RepID=A0A6A1W7S3_9ROSI|nr:hypothetical protein CJ030_MR3G006627 [Morella rubra]
MGTQSSYASTSRIRHVRGSTRGIALLKARTGGKLTIHIPDRCTGGDDKASLMLSSHIGALVRQHVPFETSKWKEVPNKVKLYVMNRVLDDFSLNYNRTEAHITVSSTMNTVYKTHKNRMFQHYSVFNSKEEALEHSYLDMNKEEWAIVCDLFVSEDHLHQQRSLILSQRLEEARLEIEEMRARQMNMKRFWSSGQIWSRRC